MTIALDKDLDSKPQKKTAVIESEHGEYLSRGRLIWRRFRRHKLARLGMTVLGTLYLVAIFANIVAPFNADTRFKGFKGAPPTRIHFVNEGGNPRTPFIYAIDKQREPNTGRVTYTEIKDVEYPVRFFVRGDSYKFLGLFRWDFHLFGVEGDVPFALFGTDDVSRDLFSRTILAARVSLFVGLGGVFISFILGCLIGGISGYMGGIVDEIIQRIIDLLISLPSIPLWMALAASIPRNWSVTKTYFAITLVLSFLGWTGLARVVRGKLLSLRDIDFVTAAKISGGSDLYIVVRHLLPNFLSYLIVSITISIPSMILGETALSFIGLGMQEPGVSWGVLLQDTMNFVSIAHQPWKLIPGIFVVVTVLMFNFVGDGLRDAADPYSL